MSGFVKKNIAIAAFILIAIAVVYYISSFKRGAYKAGAFVSISIKWGTGDRLLNSYSSTTGIYHYLDRRDRLVKKQFKLHTNEVIYLHSELTNVDFWKLPSVIKNKNSDGNDQKVLRYEITVAYDGQTKKVTYYSNYDEDLVLANSLDEFTQSIVELLNQSEERYTP